ncbi:MAG: hypothetical protein LUF92_11445 [Clostridiales bacterium]|nr:hypothetical protein [Clostridiales bacterium]
MKSLREQFEEEYMPCWVEKENDKGKVEYIYCAPWYIWDLPEEKLLRKKKLLTSFSVGSLLLLFFAGTRNNFVNTNVLVQIAGICALAIHVPELFRIIQFLFAKYRTSRMNYHAVNHVLRVVPLLRGALLVIAAIAAIYNMPGGSGGAGDWVTIFCYLVSRVMAWWIYKEYKQIPFRTEKNITFSEKD